MFSRKVNLCPRQIICLTHGTGVLNKLKHATCHSLFNATGAAVHVAQSAPALEDLYCLIQLYENTQNTAHINKNTNAFMPVVSCGRPAVGQPSVIFLPVVIITVYLDGFIFILLPQLLPFQGQSLKPFLLILFERNGGKSAQSKNAQNQSIEQPRQHERRENE